jgi:FtsH-binding integral membrane protein
MDFVNSLLGQTNVGRVPSLKTLTDFSHLEQPVVDHLKNVYLTLTGVIGISAIGAYFQIVTNFSTTLASILTFVFLLGITFSTYSGVSQEKRLALLGLFGFFEGASLGSLINHVIKIDPSIVTTALFCTTAIFVAFSAAAMFAQRRQYLYLGGYLSFSVLFMCIASFVNIFTQSTGINWILLYGGLVVFMGYVIYDTQVIIEKASHGDFNFVNHSLELFIDFVAIFVRILIILSDKKKKKNEREEKQ